MSGVNEVSAGNSVSGSVFQGLTQQVDNREVVMRIVIERPSDNYRVVYIELDDGLILDEVDGYWMSSTFADYESREKCTSISNRLTAILREQCLIK